MGTEESEIGRSCREKKPRVGEKSRSRCSGAWLVVRTVREMNDFTGKREYGYSVGDWRKLLPKI